MSRADLDHFLRLLKRAPAGAVFNPWWEVDRQNDFARIAPVIRRQQLRVYLQKRFRTAKIALIGEALGYRGGHFTGIPMTSERILLGKKPDIVAALCDRRNIRGHGGRRPPLQISSRTKAQRTSRPQICPDGFSEPTATIVWGTVLGIGLTPDRFVLWNAFPWHSFDPRQGILSNRTPNNSERTVGQPVLKVFLELFPCDQVVALGKIATAQLESLGVVAHSVRHPASGGAKMFREQIAKIVKR
jgi:hypothetical protein